MGFAEMAALRKKSRDLKNELKQLKKDMIYSVVLHRKQNLLKVGVEIIEGSALVN